MSGPPPLNRARGGTEQQAEEGLLPVRGGGRGVHHTSGIKHLQLPTIQIMQTRSLKGLTSNL
jgi:hypothetical protein